eukprot:Nitzschia sp. Nitz4//scaffold274_size25273//3445//3989//NITZ4_008323-RA/size25273-snap-gene-0.39-mRNA-1//1//CDS//3329545269//7083//frame0
MFRSVITSAFRVSGPARWNNAIGAIQTFANNAVVSTGTVKWFDSKKGFGFIVPDDGSEDVFVHQTAIHSEGFRSLADGEPVEFSLYTDNNGRTKAENVTGPMGAYVQGAPRKPRMFTNSSFGEYGSEPGSDMSGKEKF